MSHADDIDHFHTTSKHYIRDSSAGTSREQQKAMQDAGRYPNRVGCKLDRLPNIPLKPAGSELGLFPTLVPDIESKKRPGRDSISLQPGHGKRNTKLIRLAIPEYESPDSNLGRGDFCPKRRPQLKGNGSAMRANKIEECGVAPVDGDEVFCDVLADITSDKSFTGMLWREVMDWVKWFTYAFETVWKKSTESRPAFDSAIRNK